jgi:hypothetical protein
LGWSNHGERGVGIEVQRIPRAHLRMGGAGVLGGVEPGEVIGAGMTHAHVSNMREREVLGGVLQAAGVSGARIGEQRQVQRAAPERQTRRQRAFERRPRWAAVDECRDAGGQPQQDRRATRPHVEEVQVRRAVRQRGHGGAAAGERRHSKQRDERAAGKSQVARR